MLLREGQRVKVVSLLRDAIPLLCKASLGDTPYRAIEGLLGITLPDSSVILVSVKDICASETTNNDPDNPTIVLTDSDPDITVADGNGSDDENPEDSIQSDKITRSNKEVEAQEAKGKDGHPVRGRSPPDKQGKNSHQGTHNTRSKSRGEGQSEERIIETRRQAKARQSLTETTSPSNSIQPSTANLGTQRTHNQESRPHVDSSTESIQPSNPEPYDLETPGTSQHGTANTTLQALRAFRMKLRNAHVQYPPEEPQVEDSPQVPLKQCRNRPKQCSLSDCYDFTDEIEENHPVDGKRSFRQSQEPARVPSAEVECTLHMSVHGDPPEDVQEQVSPIIVTPKVSNRRGRKRKTQPTYNPKPTKARKTASNDPKAAELPHQLEEESSVAPQKKKRGRKPRTQSKTPPRTAAAKKKIASARMGKVATCSVMLEKIGSPLYRTPFSWRPYYSKFSKKTPRRTSINLSARGSKSPNSRDSNSPSSRDTNSPPSEKSRSPIPPPIYSPISEVNYNVENDKDTPFSPNERNGRLEVCAGVTNQNMHQTQIAARNSYPEPVSFWSNLAYHHAQAGRQSCTATRDPALFSPKGIYQQPCTTSSGEDAYNSPCSADIYTPPSTSSEGYPFYSPPHSNPKTPSTSTSQRHNTADALQPHPVTSNSSEMSFLNRSQMYELGSVFDNMLDSEDNRILDIIIENDDLPDLHTDANDNHIASEMCSDRAGEQPKIDNIFGILEHEIRKSSPQKTNPHKKGRGGASARSGW